MSSTSRIFLALAMLCFDSISSYANEKVEFAAGPIAESFRIEANGVELYALVRGENRNEPLLIWLHGGPGGPERPLFQYYNHDFEQHFVVTYLDQRGAGRSFDSKADPALLTVEQHLSDLDASIDFLLAKLDKKRVVLVGHSWGGALGLLYTRAHPEKVAALICVSPLIATAAGQERQLAFVRQAAAKRGEDNKLQAALGSIDEPPPLGWKADLLLQRWVDRYGGVFHKKPNRWLVLFGASLKGYALPWEVPGYIKGNNVSLAAMNKELGQLDLRQSVQEVTVPVLFALGRYDQVTDPALTTNYYQHLKATYKELVWFEDSAHNVPFEEPEQFLEAVVGFMNRANDRNQIIFHR